MKKHLLVLAAIILGLVFAGCDNGTSSSGGGKSGGKSIVGKWENGDLVAIFHSNGSGEIRWSEDDVEFFTWVAGNGYISVSHEFFGTKYFAYCGGDIFVFWNFDSEAFIRIK